MADCLIRLLFDECTDPRIANELQRKFGFDAVHVQELDWKSTKDRPLIAAATEMGRAIATYNAGEFVGYHTEMVAQGIDHPGFIVSDDYKHRIGAYINELRSALNQRAAMYGEGGEWIKNSLIFLRGVHR